MSFKWAYAGFTLALVVAACGNPSASKTDAKADANVAAIKAASAQESVAAGAAAMMAGLDATGGPGKEAMQHYLDGMSKIGDAMGTVKDEASAKAAAQVIAQVNGTLKGDVDKLNGLDEKQKASAVLASTPQLLVMQQKMATAVTNVSLQNPELMKILETELDKIPEVK